MNKTRQVMIKTPVLNETGTVVFRQCMPKLKFQRPPSINLHPTPHDIENRLRRHLELIRIARSIM